MAAEVPAALGYSMPAEWQPHSATWLAWPHNAETWPHLPQVQAIYLQLIVALRQSEAVHLLVDDATMAARVQELLRARDREAGGIIFHEYPMVDAWVRDSGPTFLTRPAGTDAPLALVDWCFNAWGNKYREMLRDDTLPQYIAARLGLPRFRPGLVLEGGAIDVNGHGSCLTTEQCLLHANRNPQRSREEIASYLHDYLGARHIIWLGEGIVGDDTDGHVDDIARFVNPTTVVCALEADPRDPNYAPLQDNYRRLQTATDQAGRPLRVIPLPMPGPLYANTERLPASYTNFYLANRLVLVPTYNHPHDRIALHVLQGLFPDRQVLGIPCAPLVWGLGAIHCITQQQPAA